MNEQPEQVTRRGFLTETLWGTCLAGLGGLAGLAVARSRGRGTVWQIDPAKCIGCGRCATHCVLQESAVKCVHTYSMCGYCRICFGFFEPQPHALHEGAENQLCPMGALQRRFVEEPYYEYNVDERLCTGCGKCVKGCNAFGNGSLHLQVRHDRCVHCNVCRIADACPSGAFRRVPAGQPYLFKGGHA